jgi:hypothetical protein
MKWYIILSNCRQEYQDQGDERLTELAQDTISHQQALVLTVFNLQDVTDILDI